MGVYPEDEVFQIHGDVRFAGSVTGAVRWRQGYLSLCQITKSNSVWLCFVYYEARDKLPASDYKLSKKTLQFVPKNPEKAEKSGFIQFVLYNGSNVWIKKNSKSQKGVFYRFAEILIGIKNGTLECEKPKNPVNRHHISPCDNNSKHTKISNNIGLSDFSYEERTPPKSIIRRHTLSSQRLLQKSVNRKRIATCGFFEENDQVIVANGYLSGSSPLCTTKPLEDRYYKRSEVLDSSYKTPTKTTPATSLFQEQYSAVSNQVSSAPGVLAMYRENGKENLSSNKENCIIKKSSPSSRRNIALKFLKEGQLKSRAVLEGESNKSSSPPKIQTGNTLMNSDKFYHGDYETPVKPDVSTAESSRNACQFVSKTSPKRSPLSEISASATKRQKRSQSPERTDQNDDEESVCDKSNTHIAGFTNIGNSCYMNSVLQALFAIRCFTDDLLEANVINEELYECALYRHLVILFLAKMEGTSKNCHLENVKEAVVSVAPWFGGTDQHDAHEFLGQVLDQLKEEVDKHSPKNHSLSNEKDSFINPVRQNFEFEMMNSYMCQGCKEVVAKKETFLMLSLDLPGNGGTHLTESVQDALDAYFQPEKLQFLCEKCHAKDACCVQTFTKLPRVLILHLKRYSFSRLSVKVAQPVVIPSFLSLHTHTEESTLPAVPVLRCKNTGSLLFSDKIINDSPVKVPDKPTSNPVEECVIKDEDDLSEEDIEKMSDQDRLLLAIERSKRDSMYSASKEKQGSSPLAVGLKGGRKEGPLSILPPVEADGNTISDCPNEKYSDETDYDGKPESKETTEVDKDQVQTALKMSLMDVRIQEEIELRKALQISIQDITETDDTEDTLSDKQNEENDTSLFSEVDNLPFSYQLTGIVSHIGQTAQSGHYLCDVYDTLEDAWWHVNDDVVQKKQKEEVLTERRTSSYLLFYVAKEALPVKDSNS